jgi:hypothetical protein
MQKRIQIAPEPQNSPIIWELFQAYRAPPNDIAMIPAVKPPIKRMAPRKSMRLIRAHTDNDWHGRCAGRMKM